MQQIALTQETFKIPPMVYMVQNDTGRTLRMDIKDATLGENDTAEVAINRSDGSYYTISATRVSEANAFTADMTQALTQPGLTKCQLKVTASTLVVSTYTFIISVEESTDGVSEEQLGVSPQELVEAAQQLTLSDNDVKLALLQIAEKVAYIDENGQTYYDALEDALYPPIRATSVTLNKNSLVFSGIGGTDTLVATVSPNNVEDDTVYWGSSDKDVAVVADGVVIATGIGSATITAICGTTHSSASVAVAQAVLLSISAVYTQTSRVHETTDLDDLKADLVVTAYWDDNTITTLTDSDYTLSGTLEEGISTITVSYSGKTATFNVSVTEVTDMWLYRFDGNIVSDGDKDLDLTGTENYGVGVDGQSFYRKVTTPGTASTDLMGVYNAAATDYPVWSNSDFTISMWSKTVSQGVGHMFGFAKYVSSTAISWNGATLTVIDTAYSASKENANKSYSGIRFGYSSGKWYLSICNAATNNGAIIRTTIPNDFDTTEWHHFALTRSGAVLYFFIDGGLVWTLTLSSSTELYSSNHVAFSSWFNTESSTQNSLSQLSQGEYLDDVYINVGTCKWTTDFDPSNISYY